MPIFRKYFDVFGTPSKANTKESKEGKIKHIGLPVTK